MEEETFEDDIEDEDFWEPSNPDYSLPNNVDSDDADYREK